MMHSWNMRFLPVAFEFELTEYEKRVIDLGWQITLISFFASRLMQLVLEIARHNSSHLNIDSHRLGRLSGYYR